MDISELRKRTQGRIHASVAAKCPSTDFLFLIVTSSSQIKKEATHEIFLTGELAYDVAMRRYIPVNILFTSLTKEQHTRLIIKYCLAGWDIGSAFFGVGKKSLFKHMIQGALKF